MNICEDKIKVFLERLSPFRNRNNRFSAQGAATMSYIPAITFF